LPILAVAGRARTFRIGRRTIEAVAWDHAQIASWEPTLAVHLAYLTREHESVLGTDQYLIENRRLSDKALMLYSIPTLRGMVVASSGAAIVQRDTTYGSLKAMDEIRFVGTANSAGVPTVVARVWSVSGAQCTKPEMFALHDLLRQTLTTDVVRIRSPHTVWRRYADAGEYLEVCLRAVSNGYSGVIESGGELTEIGDLALQIQQTLGISRPIVRPEYAGASNVYASDGASMHAWAERAGMIMASLKEQIVRTASSIV
jgi:nucleoside-diphosphate-sugar epimerase